MDYRIVFNGYDSGLPIYMGVGAMWDFIQLWLDYR
jgi:hypothetical protein